VEKMMKDFMEKYNWATRKYPCTTNLYELPLEIIARKESYEKVGRKWILVEEEKFRWNVENYMNCVDAVPFFRNLGGYERVTQNYTKYGFLPIQIDSINPDRTKKSVYKFKLI
jgi:hypothetical protein